MAKGLSEVLAADFRAAAPKERAEARNMAFAVRERESLVCPDLEYTPLVEIGCCNDAGDCTL